ncbi:unnamed protein product [Amoebophrya sp. A120]|nr:unnamed protein product [Amoebophrya sp. A120]|eukprot:GSA120T00023195001.1
MRLVGLMACTAKQHVIGKDGRLPWRIPAEFAHFQNTVVNSAVGQKEQPSSLSTPSSARQILVPPCVVMGRKTWEEFRTLEFRKKVRTIVVVSATLDVDFPAAGGAGDETDGKVVVLRNLDQLVEWKKEHSVLQHDKNFVGPEISPPRPTTAFMIGGAFLAHACADLGLLDGFLLTKIRMEYEGDVRLDVERVTRKFLRRKRSSGPEMEGVGDLQVDDPECTAAAAWLGETNHASCGTSPLTVPQIVLDHPEFFVEKYE